MSSLQLRAIVRWSMSAFCALLGLFLLYLHFWGVAYDVTWFYWSLGILLSALLYPIIALTFRSRSFRRPRLFWLIGSSTLLLSLKFFHMVALDHSRPASLAVPFAEAAASVSNVKVREVLAELTSSVAIQPTVTIATFLGRNQNPTQLYVSHLSIEVAAILRVIDLFSDKRIATTCGTSDPRKQFECFVSTAILG